MSKTYRKTNLGRKVDWLPTNWYIRNPPSETEKELEKILSETVVYIEEREYKHKDLVTKEITIKKYIVHVNQWLIQETKKKLDALHWLKKNPDYNSNTKEYFMLDYGKSPSFWNHDYHTVPRRANDRYLLNKIKKEEIDYEDVCFRDGKKPIIYYW